MEEFVKQLGSKVLEVLYNSFVAKNQERFPCIATPLNFEQLSNFLLLGEDLLDEVHFSVLSDSAAPKATGP